MPWFQRCRFAGGRFSPAEGATKGMGMIRTVAICAAALLVFGSGTAVAGPVKVEEAVPAYAKVGGVSGNLNSIGSDTLNNLMTLWAEGFQKIYPNVRMQIEGKGSSTAPAALIAATAQIGPMSRAMKPTEIDDFEKKFGYPPTKIRVAVDALAVYVNKDNPLERLTMPQVDAIFSKTRYCGRPSAIINWGDVGLSGTWGGKPISLYGRNSASGTYGYFKEKALCLGDYRDTVKEQPGSASVVQGVAEDLQGIGYSGIGYKTSGVKALSLAKDDGGVFVATDPEEVLAGRYPLARFLYVYINRAPNREPDPLVREFIRYILSRQGQEVVVKDGYLPLSASIVETEQAAFQ
jgi:phosphate transport system substrate-binding protein